MLRPSMKYVYESVDWFETWDAERDILGTIYKMDAGQEYGGGKARARL